MNGGCGSGSRPNPSTNQKVSGSSNPHVEMSLGKILNPKLLPMCVLMGDLNALMLTLKSFHSRTLVSSSFPCWPFTSYTWSVTVHWFSQSRFDWLNTQYKYKHWVQFWKCWNFQLGGFNFQCYCIFMHEQKIPHENVILPYEWIISLNFNLSYKTLHWKYCVLNPVLVQILMIFGQWPEQVVQ